MSASARERSGKTTDGAPDFLAESNKLELSQLTVLAPGTRIVAEGLIQRADIKTDRTGQPYVSLTICCADGGRLEARWWRFPYPAEHCPAAGAIYRLTGQVEMFQGCIQLRVTAAVPVPDADLSSFARASRRTPAELDADFQSLVADLDVYHAALVQEVLIGEVCGRFRTWPAAQSRHGAVRHGLLAHSVRVARIALQLGAAYGSDMLPHDSSLVIAASLLHDVDKVYTLPPIAGGALPDEARQFDHVTLGALLVRTAAERAAPRLAEERLAEERLSALLHALLAHHGTREWGAPVEPQSVEAWLVHLADLAEARLWQWSGEA